MNRSRLLIGISIAAALTIAATLYFALDRRESGSPEASTIASDVDAALDGETSLSPESEPNSEELEALFADKSYEPEQVTLDLSQERPAVRETRQMYQAHASLRSPVVDDPDSEENLEIKERLLSNVLQLAELDQQKRADAESGE